MGLKLADYFPSDGNSCNVCAMMLRYTLFDILDTFDIVNVSRGATKGDNNTAYMVEE